MPPTTHRSAGVPAVTPVPQDTHLSHAVDRHSLGEFRLGVEYPQPMPRFVVSPIRVYLEPTSPVHEFLDIHRSAAPQPLPVRLMVPGAIVTPGEAMLQPSASRVAEAVFFVTPLARGPLFSRVEMHRGNQVESLEFQVRSQGPLLPWLLAILTVLLPGLLHFLAQSDKSLTLWVQEQVMAWLPFGSGAEPLARSLSRLTEQAVAIVRDTRLSFLTFVGLTLATICLLLLRRPTWTRRWGESSPLQGAAGAKAQVPPNYLTPVSLSEINPFA